MKNYLYHIAFRVGPPIELYAGCEDEARILAQAQRIRAGMSYDVDCVYKVEE